MMEIFNPSYPGLSHVDSFKRQAIFYNGNDMHEQASGFKSAENVLSDMENSTKYAKAIILRMQESNDHWLRSLEGTIKSMQSKLRQANNMYEHLNNQFRHVVAANWFLHARIASQEETIQKDQGVYAELLKEYDNLKSKISEEHCRQTQIKPDRQSADHSNDEIDDMSRNVGGGMILRQQMDQMTREHNEHLQKLKNENEMLQKNQLQVHECYTKELKQTEVEIDNLLRELKESRTRELLAIAKSPEDMMTICVKNEQTLVKEMDLLFQDVAQKENEIKELNFSLQSVEYQSNEDRNKLHRQLQRKKGTVVILKKQKHLLQTRLKTVQETVELLKQEAFVTTGVISEPSQQLKQLIEIDAQLEKEYKKTQQELQSHDRLCSDHGVATPIELCEENIRKVSNVSRENTIPPDISTIYDRAENGETLQTGIWPGMPGGAHQSGKRTQIETQHAVGLPKEEDTAGVEQEVADPTTIPYNTGHEQSYDSNPQNDTDKQHMIDPQKGKPKQSPSKHWETFDQSQPGHQDHHDNHDQDGLRNYDNNSHCVNPSYRGYYDQLADSGQQSMAMKHMQRAAEACKQVLYGVYGNVLSILEEYEAWTQQMTAARSTSALPDQSRKMVDATQLLLFETEQRACPKEVSASVNKELRLLLNGRPSGKNAICLTRDTSQIDQQFKADDTKKATIPETHRSAMDDALTLGARRMSETMPSLFDYLDSDLKI